MHCLHCELIIFPKKYYIHTGSASDWAPFKIQFGPDGRTRQQCNTASKVEWMGLVGSRFACGTRGFAFIYTHVEWAAALTPLAPTFVRSLSLIALVAAGWPTHEIDTSTTHSTHLLTHTHSPDEMHVPRKLTRKSPKSTKQNFYI